MAHHHTLSSDISHYSSIPSPPLLRPTESFGCDVTHTLNYIVPSIPRPTLSLDAPTQPRTYLSPSNTSRKDIPKYFARKAHNRGSIFPDPYCEDEKDELLEENITTTLDSKLKHQIEEKRRRNTLSARKSRQRRIQHLQELERQRDDLQRLVDHYRSCIVALYEHLKLLGVSQEVIMSIMRLFA